MSTKFNPDTTNQIREIHNRSIAIKDKLYYEENDKGEIIVYRGTHEGRLREETNQVSTEESVNVNNSTITKLNNTVENHEIRITNIEANKADKCYSLAMSIIL